MSLLLHIDVPGQTQRFSTDVLLVGVGQNQHEYHPLISSTGVMQQELGPPLVPQLTFPTYTVDLDAPPRTIHVGAAATLRQGEGEGPYRTFFSGKVAQVLQQGPNQTRLILRSQVEEKSGIYTQATATDLATIAAALATEGGFSNNFTTWAAESDNPDGTIEQTLPTPLGQLIAQAAFEGFYTAYVEGDKITGVPMAPEAPFSLLAFPEPLQRRIAGRGTPMSWDFAILHDPFQEHITRLNLRVGRDVRVYEDANHAAEATRGREILLDLKFVAADYMNVWAERFLDRHNTEPIYLRGTFPGVFLVGDQRYADFRQGSLSGGQFEHVNGNTNRYQVVQAVYDPQGNTTRVLAKKIVAPPAYSSTGLTPVHIYIAPEEGSGGGGGGAVSSGLVGLKRVFEGRIDNILRLNQLNKYIDSGYTFPVDILNKVYMFDFGGLFATLSGSELFDLVGSGATVGGTARYLTTNDNGIQLSGSIVSLTSDRLLLIAFTRIPPEGATDYSIYEFDTIEGGGSNGGDDLDEAFSGNVDITTANVFVGTGFTLPTDWRDGIWMFNIGGQISSLRMFFGSEIHGSTVGAAVAGFASANYYFTGSTTPTPYYFAYVIATRQLLIGSSAVNRDPTPLKVWRLTKGSSSGATMTWLDGGVRSISVYQGTFLSVSPNRVLGQALSSLIDANIRYAMIGLPTWLRFSSHNRAITSSDNRSRVPAPEPLPIVALYSASDGTSTIYQPITIHMHATSVGSAIPSNVMLTAPRANVVHVTWTANTLFRTRIQWGAPATTSPAKPFVAMGEVLLSKGSSQYDIPGLPHSFETEVRVAFVDDDGTVGSYYGANLPDTGTLSWMSGGASVINIQLVASGPGSYTPNPAVLPAAVTTRTVPSGRATVLASVRYSGMLPVELRNIGSPSINLTTRVITMPTSFDGLTASNSFSMTWTATDGVQTITQKITFNVLAPTG